MNFFYTSSCGSVGPVSKEELKTLFDSGKLLPDTLIIEENGSDWKPIESLWTNKSDSNFGKKPARELRAGANTVFTIRNTGPLCIQPMPVKKVAPNAVILQDYGKMPDGSQRKVLVVGKDVIPNTPEEALKQYIPAQEARIAEIKKVLAQEEGKLVEAKKLLNRKKIRIPKAEPKLSSDESDF